jgi:hypothetical protein
MGSTVLVRFPAGIRYFSILHTFQTEPTSYTRSAVGSFPRVKGDRMVKLAIYLSVVQRKRMVDFFLHSLILFPSICLYP